MSPAKRSLQLGGEVAVGIEARDFVLVLVGHQFEKALRHGEGKFLAARAGALGLGDAHHGSAVAPSIGTFW